MVGMRIKVFCLVCAIAFCSSLALAEQNTQGNEDNGKLCIPLGNLLLKAPASVEMKLSPVDFDHPAHFDYSCKACHHTWDGGAEIQNCTTSGCHDVVTAPENPLKDGQYTKNAIKYYKYAYHEGCRNCHKELKLKNAEITTADEIVPTGPTGCAECHPKDK